MNTKTALNDEENRKADRFALIQKLGLEYKADFVPLSKSRNAKEKALSLNWSVTISRGNRSITTDYTQGIGHLPNYSSVRARVVVYHDAVVQACETGKSSIVSHKSAYDAAQTGNHYAKPLPIPAPSFEDVLHSLILDSEVLEHGTFEEWAENTAFDKDSRSAEKIYRSCLEIGLKLRAMLGDDNLQKFRDLFQGY